MKDKWRKDNHLSQPKETNGKLKQTKEEGYGLFENSYSLSSLSLTYNPLKCSLALQPTLPPKPSSPATSQETDNDQGWYHCLLRRISP